MKTLFYLLTAGLARLPLSWIRGLGSGLGWGFGSLVRYRRVEVLDRLQRCLPERSAEEYQSITRAMYAHLGLTAAEAVCLLHGRAEPILASAVLPDISVLSRALDRGRGLIILGAHLGNWEVFAVLAARSGYPATVLVKAIRGAVMNDYVTRMRTRYNLELLPQRDAYRPCLRLLKNNGILSFVLDQNMTREEGIFVDFFGQTACTSPGLAHLAAQTGAPIVPACCLRRPDGRFEVRLGELMEPPASRDPAAIRQATQAYTRVLEDWIRKDPEQWTWIHRRWRTRPLAYASDDGGRDRS